MIDLQLTKYRCNIEEEYYIDTIVEKYNLKPKILKEHHDECPVCLDTKKVFQGFYKCQHVLCHDCEESWNQNSCPLCRSE